MEAFTVERPIRELIDQLDLTIISLKDIDDLKEIRRLIYPVATLYQFLLSWEWADRQYKPTILVQDILE